MNIEHHIGKMDDICGENKHHIDMSMGGRLVATYICITEMDKGVCHFSFANFGTNEYVFLSREFEKNFSCFQNVAEILALLFVSTIHILGKRQRN